MSAFDQIHGENLEPIFEFHATNGDVFKIWVDGRTEGFGDG